MSRTAIITGFGIIAIATLGIHTHANADSNDKLEALASALNIIDELDIATNADFEQRKAEYLRNHAELLDENKDLFSGTDAIMEKLRTKRAVERINNIVSGIKGSTKAETHILKAEALEDEAYRFEVESSRLATEARQTLEEAANFSAAAGIESESRASLEIFKLAIIHAVKVLHHATEGHRLDADIEKTEADRLWDEAKRLKTESHAEFQRLHAESLRLQSEANRIAYEALRISDAAHRLYNEAKILRGKAEDENRQAH